ncbi:MAG: hypothetical protein CMB80_29635 [Flammeovirgaceae bacterium]|nr:hypothetical protein [Flammeovirgaceae bacterium]MBR10261.1 hypothetical protein [Rickettsiales bacterium]HCX20452.1 hypothetical protein [Cytophagales bacterium]|tara:strand:- start:407 stop:811 length:405 start_codon:yes stop_codon:yes gene_type:complete
MKYLSIIALLAFVVSCSSPEKKEEQAPTLKEQVMGVHDEVMPKMGELRKTQKELLALVDSSAADSVIAAKYRALATDIEMANESMMSWMRNYDPEYTGTPEEIEKYLQSELEKIETVKSDMLKSLEEGKKALAE